LPNEKTLFAKFINDEVQRKQNQQQWKTEWYESNKDIVDAKSVAEQEIQQERERREKQRREIDEEARLRWQTLKRKSKI